jgi:hypothetical protein
MVYKATPKELKGRKDECVIVAVRSLCEHNGRVSI